MAVVTTKKATPVRGGSGHMVGIQTASPARPGVISVSSTDSDSDDGAAGFPKGGRTKMFGFTGSRPAKPL